MSAISYADVIGACQYAVGGIESFKAIVDSAVSVSYV